jgi:hypothetical protein
VVNGSQVGTKNSTGTRYTGHYSIWLTNEIQQYVITLRDKMIDYPEATIRGWMNTNFYQRTKEVIGVLPIPLEVQTASGISPYVDHVYTAPSHSKAPRIRHGYLARLQNTRKAILPVHTPAERKLFRTLMQQNPKFSPSSRAQPNWDKAVPIWNRYADTEHDVYYKVTALTPLCVITRVI